MTAKFKEHFLTPHNLGTVKKHTHYSKIKSGFCGDTVEVSAIIEDNVIKDIKYNVFGCYAVIATSSMISEWCKGKTLEEIQTLSIENIKDLVGEYEVEKENCVLTAIKAFINLSENS
jgi:nitrogen fixation NifU-like protein